jgi:hypothetical protein
MCSKLAHFDFKEIYFGNVNLQWYHKSDILGFKWQETVIYYHQPALTYTNAIIKLKRKQEDKLNPL